METAQSGKLQVNKQESMSLVDCEFLPPANEIWGKVIFSVACVKNSVHGGGGSASVHAGIPHPLGAVHAGRYGQQTGGMHPTGMQSCS